MQLTPYHAKYFAHELTKRSSSDSMQKLASTFVDAQVDLNPHQVEAALFAFRSPLSKGAILADEVGLGKTIEAGLVVSQKWAERKRKILIITPSNLRKQWSQELQDKFFINSVILEAKSFNDFVKAGNFNPFAQKEIIICSYQFARSKESYIKAIKWDLAIVDEAHRLRNVYKPGNKIARSIKESLYDSPKILLTATPLQNSLLELYGLVSIIDDYTFGDLKSFKTQYSRVTSTADAEAFTVLKERLKPICKRTLRRQVLEYIRYTNRIALVEEFYPSDEEQRLYDLVTEYLQSDNLYALPASQRKLMTLILRRLLASSTFAISGTLEGLGNKLNDIVTANTTTNTEELIADDFESYDELKDDIEEEYKKTRQQLLENFDEEVHEKLRINLQESKEYLSKYESWLWSITQFSLNNNANFSKEDHSFTLINNPYPEALIHPGEYRIGKNIDDANVYRIGHPLAQKIIEDCKKAELKEIELVFDYSNSIMNIAAIENFVGKSGYMTAKMISVNSFELEEFIQLSGVSEDGFVLEKEHCERFFSLPATINDTQQIFPSEFISIIETELSANKSVLLDEIGLRNTQFFEIELEKLDLWGEDRRNSLKVTLKDLDAEIKEIKKLACTVPNLPEKLKFEKERKKLENERDTAWREYDGAAKEIEHNKDRLIEQVEKGLEQRILEQVLFTIKWKML